jgi:hypothetical protein
MQNLKSHYCVHNGPTLTPFLNHMHPFHIPTLYALQIHYNINLPPMPVSLSLFPSDFMINFLHAFLLTCMTATSPNHLFQFNP